MSGDQIRPLGGNRQVREACTEPAQHATLPAAHRRRSGGRSDLPTATRALCGRSAGALYLADRVFIEIYSIAAHVLGCELDVAYDHSPMYPRGDYETPQIVARMQLSALALSTDDLDANLILRRQTSRLA